MPSSAAAKSGLVGRGMGNPLGAAKRCWATMAYRQRLNLMVPVNQSCSRGNEACYDRSEQVCCRQVIP